MIGKIFITSTGYDPECGKDVKDPYLGDMPSLGACRPDVRRAVAPGDYIFTISGKVAGVPQYIMGGLEVERTLPAAEAYRLFLKQRLRMRKDGQIDGNIIVDSRGEQHRLDGHAGGASFRRRIAADYVVGKNPVALLTTPEVSRGRVESLEILCRALSKVAGSPFALIGRKAKTLDDRQVLVILEWLLSVKETASFDVLNENEELSRAKDAG